MNYVITRTTYSAVQTMMNDYLNTLNGVVDDFWETHIQNSEFYEISISNLKIGYLAIFEKEKLTQFYMPAEHLKLAQEIFKDVLDKFSIKNAFVSTSDQLFLSLCLDFHSKVELQAYFFDGSVTGEVRQPEYGRGSLTSVKFNELEDINKETGNFFDFVTQEEMDQGVVKLYQLIDKEDKLGYGIIVPNKLLTKYWACGMITLEAKRQNGVGRSILIHLADICKENGFIPISGCYYYNHLSKKTIESAGKYSKTRLLNVSF